MRFPRASGVLLHPTSLPGPHGSGDFGPRPTTSSTGWSPAGQKLWQFLPLGGIGAGQLALHEQLGLRRQRAADRPARTAAARLARRRRPRARCRASPAQRGATSRAVGALPHGSGWRARPRALRTARPRRAQRAAFAAFCAEQAAVARRLRALHGAGPKHSGWQRLVRLAGRRWRAREPAALAAARQRSTPSASHFWHFCQWCFFRQWAALQAPTPTSAASQIIGDMPIFVAHHSADVWAQPASCSSSTPTGRPTVVAGVPPDYFSADRPALGQPAVPLERARAGAATPGGSRACARTFELVDVVRIDHFRGFAGYWEIPRRRADRRSTAAGCRARARRSSRPSPSALGPLPDHRRGPGRHHARRRRAARRRSSSPACASCSSPSAAAATTRYLPHNHEPRHAWSTPARTTTTPRVGWWAARRRRSERHFARRYLATDGARHPLGPDPRRLRERRPTPRVLPLQDVLGLGAERRMNFPGKRRRQLGLALPAGARCSPEHAERLAAAVPRLYRRDEHAAAHEARRCNEKGAPEGAPCS